MSSLSDWKSVEFGEIAEQIIDRVDNPTDSELADYIGLEHIESNNLKISNYGKSNGVVSSKFVCRKGDIIFGRRRAYLRKLAISERCALVSTDAMVIRPKDNVSKEFLILTMQTDRFWDDVISRSAGSLSPRIKWRDLSSIDVLLPPPKVQKEISKLIFSVQDNIEETQNLIQVAEKLKKGLLERLLTKGIGHTKFKVTYLGEVPEEWASVKLADLVCFIRNGTTEKQVDHTTKYPVTRIETIANGSISLEHVGYIAGENRIQDYLVKEGDILFSHINSVAHIGKVAIFAGKDALYHGMNLLLIRPNPEKVLPEFLFLLLKWENTKEYFETNCKKAINQASLNQKDVGNLKILLPSKLEQEAIVTVSRTLNRCLQTYIDHTLSLKNLKAKLTNSFLSGDLLIPKEVMN